MLEDKWVVHFNFEANSLTITDHALQWDQGEVNRKVKTLPREQQEFVLKMAKAILGIDT